MKPVALIGALFTLIVALVVISKLTSPRPAVETVVAPTAPPATPSAADGHNHDHDHEHGEGDKGKEESPADASREFNPFDLKQPGPYPSAILTEDKYVFGDMPLGTTRSHTFVIKNAGDAPLKLEKGPVQCKCTLPALKDKEIPPGGEAQIVLEWKPLALQSDFEKEAVIWTNDPANPRLVLAISGNVVSDDFWQPIDSFNLEQVKQGTEKTVTGTIMSRTRDNLQIVAVDKTSDNIKVDYVPATPEQLAAENARCGYVFTITVNSSEEISLIRETVTVTVNSENNKTIVWQVVGSRTGPISIIGKDWYSEKQLIQLGRFKASEGIEKKLSMFVTDKTEEAMTLTEVQADAPIQVALERDAAWTGTANDRYWLTVKFLPGGPPSQRGLDAPLEINLKTSHPKIPFLKVNVSYDAD